MFLFCFVLFVVLICVAVIQIMIDYPTRVRVLCFIAYCHDCAFPLVICFFLYADNSFFLSGDQAILCVAQNTACVVGYNQSTGWVSTDDPCQCVASYLGGVNVNIDGSLKITHNQLSSTNLTQIRQKNSNISSGKWTNL